MGEPKNQVNHLGSLQMESGKLRVYQELKRSIDFKARKKGIPISGKFELTPLCNFSCRMCYVHLNATQLDGRPVLPVDVWKELMYQAWEAGMITATLSGGECLTYPGFEELYIYLHSLGCEVSVLTNGFLLDEKTIQFFKVHKPELIQVSLYGWNDDVYERVTGQRVFSTVAENIKRASEASIPISISITPSVYLGEDLIETIRVAKELSKDVSINACIIPPRKETGRSNQQDDIGTELYIRAYQYFNNLSGRKTEIINEEKLPPSGGQFHTISECGLLCGGGRSTFAIDWKGMMKPCVNFETICAYPLKDGFASAWSEVNQKANHWPRVPECKGCAYEKVCNNCAANMLRYAEPGKVPIGLCERTRELVRNGILELPDC